MGLIYPLAKHNHTRMSSEVPVLLPKGFITPDGVVKCRHGWDALNLFSQTPKNPNREFYRCRYDMDDPRDCKFYCWADEISWKLSVLPAASTNTSSPPQLSQPDSTPRSTSSQSTATRSTGVMTTSQPAAPESTRPVASSSTGSTPRPSQPQADTVTGLLPSQTPSTAPHDIESDDELSAPANTKRSLPSTPRGSSTPKRRRIDDDSSSGLLTPPSSSRHPLFASPPGTPTRSNGNNTELTMPPASRISTDSPSSQLVPLAANMRILSPMSASTTHEGDTAAAKKLTEPTWESIATLAEEISYVARKMTADKSMEAKDERIAQLEEENLQLKKQNEEWQRIFKDLKSVFEGANLFFV